MKKVFNKKLPLPLKFYFMRHISANDKATVMDVFTGENTFYKTKTYTFFQNYRPISKLIKNEN